MFAAVPLDSTASALADLQLRFGLITAMAVITSTPYFIGKQDGGKNLLSQNNRADRKLSRRYRCVSRGGMVNKSEGIGGIDGAHDEDAGYLRHFDSTRLWLITFLPRVIQPH